ncbi:MAG TPA: hypothetical protein VFS05_07105, partial [Gemmatimonadaceae bacterium]|nr:hypothetical protein [Gemmatimonadaceae bacterium]
FFVTIWWHVQNPERWPGYQLSARQALQAEEGLFAPSGDIVEDYFAYRDAFRELAAALGAGAWELEYLCWWSRHRDDRESPELVYDAGRRRAPAAVRERPVAPAIAREPVPRRRIAPHRATAEHTHIQWLLATMGRKLGCRVWIAANDRGRSWQGETLGDLSIRRLPPLGMDADSQRVVSLIDVVWLRGANRVIAAFEVELTTSVYSGLLRMADLAALAPNLNFPLYIVAPASRAEKVRRELARPSFQALDLPARSGVLSAEALAEAAESIMRWGSDPRVLDRLALRADERAAADVARRGA